MSELREAVDGLKISSDDKIERRNSYGSHVSTNSTSIPSLNVSNSNDNNNNNNDDDVKKEKHRRRQRSKSNSEVFAGTDVCVLADTDEPSEPMPDNELKSSLQQGINIYCIVFVF